MILYTILMLLTLIWWQKEISILFLDHRFEMPFSVVLIAYITSLFVLVKIINFIKRLSKKDMALRAKAQAAKEKCIEAMLYFIGGDIEGGRILWVEAKKYLEKDPLFLLLCIKNKEFDEQGAYEAANALGTAYKSSLKRLVDERKMLSKENLMKLTNEYSLPWAYRRLIDHYLEISDTIKSEEILQKFWKSGKLLSSEWKQIRAKIFMKEADFITDAESQYTLWKKANRLNRYEAVFELVQYYRKNNIEKGRKLIESVWKDIPSIKLGKLYIELDETDLIPIHKFQHAKSLANLNPEHAISNLLLATYAMESELWSIAREALEKFREKYPDLAYILLARLEAKHSNSHTKVWANIEKAFVSAGEREQLDLKFLL